ncbi:MAG: agmatine deiminase family protein [Deltaproteobacteria bacterium]
MYIKRSIGFPKSKKAYLIYFGFNKREWAIASGIVLGILIFSIVLYGKLTSYAGNCVAADMLPAEFEEQQSVWLMWPSEIYNVHNDPVEPVILELVRNLAPYVKINIMVANKSEAAEIKKKLARQDCADSNIDYHVVDHYSIWARDVGPLFVKDKNQRLCVVDFRFNNYGRYGDHYYINTEDQVDSEIAKKLRFPLIESSLVSEGGSVESNGQGTLILTEAVTVRHNPGMSRDQIEKEYKRVLGAKKVIWLKHGLAEDKVTGGHVDEFVRFTDARTILLAEVLPADKDSSSLAEKSGIYLEENYNILLRAVDRNGQPFRIIRIPMPPTMYGDAGIDDEIPVRSYMNYVVTNGAVIVPTYWKPGRPQVLKDTEDEVLKTFRAVFPGREIIRIDAEAINSWGGGLHCVTQHMPTVTSD